MVSPPEPIVLAAVRWLELVPSAGVRRSRALLTTLAEFSDLTPTQYDAAWDWLQNLGVEPHSRIPPRQRIFSSYLRWQNPPWLRHADDLVTSFEEVPLDADDLARSLGLDDAEMFALVRNLGRKVDSAARAAYGSAGEEALVNYLQRTLSAEVEHVAEWSDGHGYDISVSGAGQCFHLEVKSSGLRQGLRLFLSRNEFEVMCRDPDWVLVGVSLTETGELGRIASIPADWVRKNSPQDHGGYGKWESLRLKVPESVQIKGIPQLRPLIARDGGLL